MACAPSSSTCWPASSASCTSPTVSAIIGSSRGRQTSRYSAAISSAETGSWLKTRLSTAFFSLSTTSSFWRKIFGIEQVLHPQTDPRRLVGVGRADAALGGAELVAAESPLGHLVELLVVREDQVGVAAHLEPAGVDTPPGEHVELGEQHPRVDHHAVADHRGDVVVEDAARHQLEGEALAVDHDGVPRVVTALVADDEVHLLGEEVGEPTLPLIAPLGPDDDGRWHGSCSFGDVVLRSEPSRPRAGPDRTPERVAARTGWWAGRSRPTTTHQRDLLLLDLDPGRSHEAAARRSGASGRSPAGRSCPSAPVLGSVPGSVVVGGVACWPSTSVSGFFSVTDTVFCVVVGHDGHRVRRRPRLGVPQV